MTRYKQFSNSKKQAPNWLLVIGYCLFLVSCILFLAAPILAQQVSLSLTPPHLETIIKPGKSVLVAYTVQNYGDPTVMKIRVLPFSPKGTEGEIQIAEQFEGPVRFSLDNSDLELDTAFFLNTRDRQQVLLRIRIPDGAPEGDYYYSFIAETVPTPGTEGISQSKTQARVAVPILITITQSGDLDIRGKVDFFDVIPRLKIGSVKLFDSGDKIPVVLIVRNEGKNFINPEGDIILKETFGTKSSYSIVPQNVLAQSQRLMIATPSAEVDCEGSRAVYCKRPITLLLSGLFLGKYTLSTEINFGEATQHVFGSTSFIAFPIKFMIGLLAGLIIGILLVRRFGK